jgi:hypothetical protein
MRSFLRACSVLFFSAVFGLLISGLFAYAAAEDAIQVHPVDSHYPIEDLKKDPRFPIEVPKKKTPWYVTKSKLRYRIFEAGGLQSQIKNWDELEKDLFLQRLDAKGASGVASRYKQFSLSQLREAEKELRRLKEEK